MLSNPFWIDLWLNVITWFGKIIPQWIGAAFFAGCMIWSICKKRMGLKNVKYNEGLLVKFSVKQNRNLISWFFFSFWRWRRFWKMGIYNRLVDVILERVSCQNIKSARDCLVLINDLAKLESLNFRKLLFSTHHLCTHTAIQFSGKKLKSRVCYIFYLFRTVAAQALKCWWGSRGVHFFGYIFIAFLGDLGKWSLLVNLKYWWGSSLTGLNVSAAPGLGPSLAPILSSLFLNFLGVSFIFYETVPNQFYSTTQNKKGQLKYSSRVHIGSLDKCTLSTYFEIKLNPLQSTWIFSSNWFFFPLHSKISTVHNSSFECL